MRGAEPQRLPPPRSPLPPAYWRGLYGLCAAALVLAVQVSLRKFLTFGTETDFLWAYRPNAERFLAGQPLRIHGGGGEPPLYSITLGLIHWTGGAWVSNGLWLSLASSVVVLAANYHFFYRLLGPYAAWGSLLGMATSMLFVVVSATATTGMFFLALYSCCMVAALEAASSRSAQPWLILGVCCGLTVLARLNGFTVLILFLLPWISSAAKERRGKYFLILCAGLAVPLLAWGLLARFVGGDYIPGGVTHGLAVTYFSEASNRISYEGAAATPLLKTFTNPFQVLAHDPIHFTARYLEAYGFMLQRAFDGLLAAPLKHLAFPGFFILLLGAAGPTANLIWLYLSMTLAQAALVNMINFENRHYLFLIPLLGAAAGCCWEHLARLSAQSRSKPASWRLAAAALAVFAPLCLSSLWQANAGAYRALHAQDDEFAEAIPAIKSLGAGRVLITRQPHLPYYTGSGQLVFPVAKSLDELRLALAPSAAAKDLYLYFGSSERFFRSEMRDLSVPEKHPNWLMPVAQSRAPGAWVLYQVRLAATSKTLR